jgi:hypothetical protein
MPADNSSSVVSIPRHTSRGGHVVVESVTFNACHTLLTLFGQPLSFKCYIVFDAILFDIV